MNTGQPSQTALAAAAHRAAHQLLDEGRVFQDPLAVKLIDAEPAQIARDAAEHPDRRPMRFFIAARTRFAEDALARAVARGVRQLVVLGAGLDTYAYRNPHEASGLKVFEVDHPATQAWKRERLLAAGIPVPASLAFAPVDFEQASLLQGLLDVGFRPDQASFFTWLGVVPYLTREAVFATLGVIAALPGGAEVVFDYSDPPGERELADRAAHQSRANAVAAIGEPWLCYFGAEALADDLHGLGFVEIEDLGPSEVAARYFGAPADAPGRKGGHVIRTGRIT